MANVLERQTRAFIKANPISVALQRWNRIQTTAGGYRLEKGDLLMAQEARLVHSQNKGDRFSRTIPDGRVVIEESTLVMESSGDVQVGDTFAAEGKEWIVGSVFTTIHESVNARVGSRGSG